jgi:hypothetical protein
LADQYDVTIIGVRPGTHPQALAVLGKTLAGDAALLACWYAEIGAVNRIMLIRKPANAAAAIEARFAALKDTNPLGIGEFVTDMTMDTYVAFGATTCLNPAGWRRPWSCGARRFRAVRRFRRFSPR